MDPATTYIDISTQYYFLMIKDVRIDMHFSEYIH